MNKTFGVLYKPKGVANKRQTVRDFWYACSGSDLMRLLPNGKTVRVNYEDDFKKDQDVILFMGPDSDKYPVTRFKAGFGIIHNCRIVDSPCPSLFIHAFEDILEKDEFNALLAAFIKTGSEYILFSKDGVKYSGFYEVGDFLCTLRLKEEVEPPPPPRFERKATPIRTPKPGSIDIGMTLDRVNRHALSFSEGRFTETSQTVYSLSPSCPFAKIAVGDILKSIHRKKGCMETHSYGVNAQAIIDNLTRNPEQVSLIVLRHQADVNAWVEVKCPYKSEEKSHMMFQSLSAAAKNYFHGECTPTAQEYLNKAESYVHELNEGEPLYNLGLRRGDIICSVTHKENVITNPSPIQIYNLLHKNSLDEISFYVIRGGDSCRYLLDVKKQSLTKQQRDAIISRIVESAAYTSEAAMLEYKEQLDFLDDQTLLEQPGAKK